MISHRTSNPFDPSRFSFFNMRGIVLLCVLHTVFGMEMRPFHFQWPTQIKPPFTDYASKVCHLDLTSCSCCLMQRQKSRIEEFFNYTFKAINEEILATKTALLESDSRSAFSVALNNNQGCLGPFDKSRIIIYEHVFINIGDSYSIKSGIFTVPRNGVYSLSVTIYGANSVDSMNPACAILRVNDQEISKLLENLDEEDYEDSASFVIAIALKVGDQVAVFLPPGCAVCDFNSFFNSFTGFLLYAGDYS